MNTEDPYVDCPITIGMCLFIDQHIYEVERLTKIRAYVRCLTPGNPVTHETDWGLNYGPRLKGNDGGNGQYIDIEYWRQSKSDGLIIVKSPGATTLPLAASAIDLAMLVRQAKEAALPHVAEIVRLQDELKAAKKAQHGAIIGVMTGET